MSYRLNSLFLRKLAGAALMNAKLEDEDSNAAATARNLELQSPKNFRGGEEERAPLNSEMSLGEYSEVLRELGHVKTELSRLKLDMASASEAIAKAEKQIEVSGEKTRMGSSHIEELKTEIEEVNVEQVLVELATMEAEIEYEDIETRRAAEAAEFSAAMEKAKQRITDCRNKFGCAEELETLLALATSEAYVLQNEMEFIRAMERNFPKDQIKKTEDGSSAEAELKAVKNVLAKAKAEGYQLMNSMDQIRGEMMHIADESERLMNVKKISDSDIQHLNSELIESKSRLESALVTGQRTNAILVNLSAALQQLQADTEEAEKERALITQETKSIKIETENIDFEIDSTEARLQAAMEELRAVKASESIALSNLKVVAEGRMRSRALLSRHSSSITISAFEFVFLKGRAESAEEVADEKLAAAQVWIEALEARENEIMLHAEIVERDIEGLRVGGEKEMDDLLRSLEIEGLRVGGEKEMNGEVGESRRDKVRRPSVSSERRRSITRSPASAVKRKRKVITNLVRILKVGQRTGKFK